MTQMDLARSGIASAELKGVSVREQVSEAELIGLVAAGQIAIPCNKNHKGLKAVGIGRGLATKVNANIGTSPDNPDSTLDVAKLNAALDAGADAIMDLSVAGDIRAHRLELISQCPAPVGTVPIYEVAARAKQVNGDKTAFTVEELFGVIQEQAEDGVDFMTLHAGVTKAALNRLRNEGRLTDIVSRGGSLLAEWMENNESENPLMLHYDRLLDICREYDVTLSLGDGLRPGCLADATDRAQIEELISLGELTDRAWQKGVQVMIEGPGHVPLNQIEANMLLEKRLCHGAPFYVLGPIVTDVAPGYDHITSAIGGAIAAVSGADFICYVTPAEHLSLPTLEHVREGVIAARIAAHAADIVKGVPGAMEWDRQMAEARKARDWQRQLELSLDKVRPAELRCASMPADPNVCTMCGDFCAMKTSDKVIKRH